MRFNPAIIAGGELAGLRGERCRRGLQRRGAPRSRRQIAFTLLELLVVMAVIGILATIAVPSLKGLGGTTDVDSASRQLSDDLSYARLKAISERTRVYVIFIPPDITEVQWRNLPPDQAKELQRLASGQYTTYALYSERSLGDQPGNPRPSYLTEWRTLPQGVFVATNKFRRTVTESERLSYPLTNRPFAYYPVRFPTENAQKPHPLREINKHLPAIVFDYQGRLVPPPNATVASDEFIPITKGSLIYPVDAAGNYILSPAEVIETPRNNHTNNSAVMVDWLTGRARIVLPGGRKT